MTVPYALVMDLDAITPADLAASLALSVDYDYSRHGNIEVMDITFQPTSLSLIPGKLSTNLPSGDAQLEFTVTDGEGVTRSYTSRITVKETR